MDFLLGTCDFGLKSVDLRVKGVIDVVDLPVVVQGVIDGLALTVHEYRVDVPFLLADHVLDVLVEVVVLVFLGVAGLCEALECVDLWLDLPDVGQEHIVVRDFDALLGLSGLRLADFELRDVLVGAEVFDGGWYFIKVLSGFL